MDQNLVKPRAFGREPSKLGSFGVSGGLRRPYCSTKSLTLGLLLFTDPSVVIVQVLTIRTVFSAQR